MNTLSIPTTASPEGKFHQGAVSPHAAPQGEVSSSSDSHHRIDRDTRRLINASMIAAVAMLWFGLRYPVALAMIFCIGGSAAVIIFVCCWNGHRGDQVIGVGDTQGRDMDMN